MKLEKHIAIRTPTSHLEPAICMLKVMDFFQVQYMYTYLTAECNGETFHQ